MNTKRLPTQDESSEYVGPEQPPIVGYMVHSASIDHAAMYPLAQKSEAFDAAHRWNASITALTVHPSCPTPA